MKSKLAIAGFIISLIIIFSYFISLIGFLVLSTLPSFGSELILLFLSGLYSPFFWGFPFFVILALVGIGLSIAGIICIKRNKQLTGIGYAIAGLILNIAIFIIYFFIVSNI